MAMENKRIIQLNTERTTPASDDFVMVDSATDGTAKYQLSKITDAIDQEITDRTSADTALQTAITNEATARTNADTTLQGNITAEATARAAADTAINGEITQLREDLTAEETARESADEAINAELATKADADGTIASAEQLLSDKYTIDQVPYTFRASGGDGADREYDEIVGGSIVWNQLCNGSSVTVLNGHKYYMLKSGTASIGASTGSAITGLTSGTDMVSDLTQMLGSTIADYIYSLEQATAGAGVAWLKTHFPKMFDAGYQAYNAGTMMHVSGLSSHDMVGFNQWDEEWELGEINTQTGEVISGSYVISTDMIPVIPKSTYYFNRGSHNMWLYFYDSDGNYFKATSVGYRYLPSGINETTIPENAHYMRFVVNTTYGTTYKNDICINLSWDGERDGEYEPYVKHSYPLDDSLTLRGIPKLDENNQLYYDGDIYSADGTVTRKYGSVILNGSESWTLEGSLSDEDGNPTSRFYIEKSDLVKPSGTVYTRNYVGRMVSAIPTLKGGYVSQFSMTGVEMGVTGYQGDSGQYLYIIVNNTINTTITTVNALKSWLASHPLEVVYELATPTTEEAEPYQELQLCDPNGTEEYVTTSLVPVGHYTKYPANLRSAIERVMEQVPEAPSANGTYTLKATRTSSGVTYAWTAE